MKIALVNVLKHFEMRQSPEYKHVFRVLRKYSFGKENILKGNVNGCLGTSLTKNLP